MRHFLEEYPYEGMSGEKYQPYFNTDKQKWCLKTDRNEYTLTEIALLCDIPAGEVVFLTLQYGP